MKSKHIVGKIILFNAMLCFLMGFIIHDRALSFESADWERGAAGFELALMDAEVEEKPLVVYFYTDGSEWCEKMDKNYLEVGEIADFLINIPKAAIKPEEGESEGALADRYGVKDYPAFFIYVPSFKTEPQRIHPFSKDKTLTPDEFLKLLKDVIVSQYNKRAFSYFEKKDYENTLKYFELALKFDSDRAYNYYAMGVVYHNMAHEKNMPDYLKKAEENYVRALQLDPKHKESKVELEKLRKDSKKK